MHTALFVCIVMVALAIELTLIVKVIQKSRSILLTCLMIVAMFMVNAILFVFYL